MGQRLPVFVGAGAFFGWIISSALRSVSALVPDVKAAGLVGINGLSPLSAATTNTAQA